MNKKETNLIGKALCLVDLGFNQKIVTTLIKVPAVYTYDCQCDGGFWHDEGHFDFDFKDAIAIYPDEYEEINAEGIKTIGNQKIKKIISVFEDNLQEEIL